MIDLGLTKIALIGVVALVVIGPEKLPRVARMAGTLYGRAQRYILQVKTEVSREIELDELRKMHKDVQEAASDVGQSISKSMNEVESSMQSAWSGNAYEENALSDTPTPDQVAVKAKLFRKKKLARNSALPSWYKHQNGHKSHVISGAARVARYRPSGSSGNGFFL
ncbi:Sec-independent protein translocase protein TatB [Actimicrobium sp. CCI2.3]|uniref:Sec-independent protein translocase protein TatB n=1 Tax=Actimicrobium sp. CCI2.3 TaxID=3048616 RepID=UPI002AB4F9EF|nr:Sec-independent protein translocase protein TatB [Actimicrobium sp. CCI2.3]MDY7573382.1 Sec-independent protein translocase protein TatB [Actimicrobium sp. CCI2.3]MEB0021780.1 Sec-independent protein translocase protein TatB [Actimicrobium sp. CCI2.3]